jgi:hypothetical protein
MTPATRRKIKATLARVPGALEASLTARDALLTTPDPARPGRAFRRWLQELDAARPLPQPQPERRVLVFACREQWLRWSLATTVILLGRNCRVDFAFLPGIRSEGEESLLQTKEFEIYWGKYFRGHRHPRLRFIDLRRLDPAPVPAALAAQAEAQSLLDTRWVLQREEIDPQGNPEHRALFEFRQRRNLDCMARLLSQLQGESYDVMLLPHGNLRELGAAFAAGRHAGQKIVTIDFKEREESIVLSGHEAVGRMDLSREWAAAAPHVLSAAARHRVGDLISTRQGVEWEGFRQKYQQAAYCGDRSRVLADLGMPPGGPLALLCPNVAWDSALQGRDRAFPSLIAWIRHTVQLFAARTDARLVVRVHPAEILAGTAEPVADVIRQCCPDLPEHIRVIGPRDPVNTYSLMDACDFGLVYNSTAGLEMALRGLPTLVSGRPHYSEKGFTTDIEDPAHYRAAIEGRLTRLSERQVELAWCYADVFFFGWHHPFPWCMPSFWKDMSRWPITRVLSPEGQERFGRTFDLLVNRPGS